MPGTISQYQVVIAGQLITASLWNGMELNIINNGLVPAGIDDYSANDTEMQTMTDPYPAGATSRPTSLQGEMERVRYQIDNIIGKTYWYEDPDVTIAVMKTNFDAHTHSGAANQGPQIAATGLASDSVITAKILDSNVTTAKIADLNVTTAKIADLNVTTGKIDDLAVTTAKIAAAAVDENKLASSVAGNGLDGGAGTALSVNVDASTIEINTDTLRVKDAGITEAKLATAVVNKLGQNIGLVAIASTSTGTANIVSYTGQGRLKGVHCDAAAISITIVVDGVTVFGPTVVNNTEVIWGTTSLTTGSGTLNSLDIHFRTSLVVSRTGGGGTAAYVAYERAA